MNPLPTKDTALVSGVRIERLLLATGKELWRGSGAYMTVGQEAGQMGWVPWIIVHDYSGNELERINCAYVERLTLIADKNYRFPFEQNEF